MKEHKWEGGKYKGTYKMWQQHIDKAGKHEAKEKALKSFRGERLELRKTSSRGQMSAGEHNDRALSIEKKYKRDYHTGRERK